MAAVAPTVAATSSAQQKRLLKQLKDITGATDRIGEDLLKKHKWNVEQAVSAFYDLPAAAVGKQGDIMKLGQLFEKYAAPENPNEMSDDGITLFFDDVKIDPNGVLGLAIGWKLDCKKSGTITRDEFLKGFSTAGADSMPAVCQYVEKIKREIADPTEYRKMYKWVFHYMKGGEQKRSLDKELGLALMEGLIDKQKYPLAEVYLNFLRGHKDKGIPRDVWDLSLDFISTHNLDLSNFDDNGAWPVVVDEFVAAFRGNKL